MSDTLPPEVAMLYPKGWLARVAMLRQAGPKTRAELEELVAAHEHCTPEVARGRVGKMLREGTLRKREDGLISLIGEQAS